MKPTIGFIFIFLIAVRPGNSSAQDVPSSLRSRIVISRIKPKLQNELENKGFHWGMPVFIRIFKQTKELEIWVLDNSRYKLFKIYKICTYGRRGLGPKKIQGDGKAPEGFYYVAPRHLNPRSKYHLSFNLGYPNVYDIIHRRTGGALMVHGKCVSIGCYAMTDKNIEEIYSMVDAALNNGKPFVRVHIFPFRMTTENMQRYKPSKHYKFWKNLKEGYDYFHLKGYRPPNVTVRNKRYVFE